MKRRLLLACVLLPLALPAAAARDWPDRPIRIIVASGSGSASESVARTLARALQKSVGQPVTVESGAVKLVKSAPPDGYTLLFATSAILAGFDPIADLAPVAAVGAFPYAMFVNAKVPVRSVQDLVAYARTTKLAYATTNRGEDLAATHFARSAGIEMTPTPYNASPMGDLAAGRVQVYVTLLGPALAESRNSRVRLLATLTQERTPVSPAVPSLGEEALAVPPANMSHVMLLAPAKTHIDIVARLAREVQAAVGSKDVKAELLRLGLMPKASGAGELAKQLAEEQKIWR
jgi:tripartite-type tricarboxylate transporter receptor subunit TctC